MEGDDKDLQLFQLVEFTHALVLKVNQLSKQVKILIGTLELKIAICRPRGGVLGKNLIFPDSTLKPNSLERS